MASEPRAVRRRTIYESATAPLYMHSTCTVHSPNLYYSTLAEWLVFGGVLQFYFL